MARKRYVLFRDQIRDFCKKGWESEVIGVKGDIILVEAEVPEEEPGNESALAMEDSINEPGEC